MKDGRKYRLKIFAIFIIPFLVTILAIQLKKATGPYWLGANSDPSYIYLVNSLYIIDGIAPIFVDHPGTTLQMLGALVIKVLNWNMNNHEIAGKVFGDPEYYLNAIHFVLLSIYIGSLIAIGLYAWKKTKSVICPLIIQVSSFFFLTTIPVMASVNAEALVITVVNLYVLCALKLYFDFENQKGSWLAAWFGIVCALGVVTKMTFLPLMMAPIILCRGIKAKLIFCVVFLISWFILTIPVIPRYAKMFHWWNGLIIYTGVHGSGERGLIDVHSCILTIENLIKADYFLFGIIICYSVAIFRHTKFLGNKNRSNQELRKILLFSSVFLLIVLAQFLMAAKQGAEHYMAPSVGLTGLLIYLLFEYSRMNLKADWRVCVAILFLFIVSFTFMAVQYSNKLCQKNGEIYRFSTMIHKKYKGCIICGYYRSSSPQVAMDFGDDCYGFKAYGQLLQEKYPNAYFYNRWNHLFHRFSDYVYPQDLLRKNECVLLYGDAAVFPEYLQVREIESSPGEKLYKILSTTAEEAVKYYLAAKSLEVRHEYSAAYGFALKAKSMGFPKIDLYLKELLERQNKFQ